MNIPTDAAPQETGQDVAARDDQDAAAAPSAPVPSTPELSARVTPPPPAPPIPPAPPTPILPAQSGEDTDVGWGDYADQDDNDRLLRDRPPHWGNG